MDLDVELMCSGAVAQASPSVQQFNKQIPVMCLFREKRMGSNGNNQ